MVACNSSEDDKFEEPAAVRMNNALTQIKSTLVGSANGWVMYYYATSEASGYSLLVKFSASGEAVVAAKNEFFQGRYTEDKSLYAIIGDNGPVLTFNTFNQVLHLFSNPENPDGSGLEGDYEFVVLNYTDDEIILKGKKRGTVIAMQRVPEGESWPSYFEKLDKMENDLIGTEPLYLFSEKDTVIALTGLNHIFDFISLNENFPAQMPFIITQNGLRFYSPITMTNKKVVQSFTLSADGVKLVADTDKATYFAGPGILAYVMNSQSTFAFDTSLMSSHFKVPVQELYRQMKEKYSGKRNVDYLAISYKSGFGKSFYFSTTPTITEANYNLSLKSTSSNDKVVTIQRDKNVYDNNGALFYNVVPAIEDVWKELEGNYLLVSTLSKREIKFVDMNNESRFFVIKKK
jgi:hypothetical protein